MSRDVKFDESNYKYEKKPNNQTESIHTTEEYYEEVEYLEDTNNEEQGNVIKKMYIKRNIQKNNEDLKDYQKYQQSLMIMR